MSNLDKYNEIFMETFGITEERLAGMQANVCAEWDSIIHIQLIAAMENSFDIMLEVDDILEFNSYNNGKMILAKYNVVL